MPLLLVLVADVRGGAFITQATGFPVLRRLLLLQEEIESLTHFISHRVCVSERVSREV